MRSHRDPQERGGPIPRAEIFKAERSGNSDSMIEILLLVGLLMATKKPQRRRRMGRYLKGNVEEELALATLGAGDVTKADFDQVMIEKGFVSSLVATYAMRNLTVAADIGPFTVGIAHSDYTSAEIEEYLENTGSWNIGDKVNQEINKRLVRVIGIFPAAGQSLGTSVLNDGKPIKTKLNWSLITGKTLCVWVRNGGSAPVATTVPDIKVDGHINLWL